MPRLTCKTIRDFHESALQAQNDAEVLRLLAQARQALLARGFQCREFPGCLSEALTRVQIERERRKALSANQLLALQPPEVMSLPVGIGQQITARR